MRVVGKGVSGGIAIAPVIHFKRAQLSIENRPVQSTDVELERFEAAQTEAIAQLSHLAAQLKETLGEENALLFEIHQMMLQEPDYLDAVRSAVLTQNLCAEQAVHAVALQFAEAFSQMDDAYMRARAADVQDVSRRVIEILMGVQEGESPTDQPVILLAEDFAPSETARFDSAMVKGLVTSGGAVNSHTAIFARVMGIPAIIGLGESLCDIPEGSLAILDGDTGELHLNPNAELTETYRHKAFRLEVEKDALETYRGKPTQTKAGVPVRLYANIGSLADAERAMVNDAEGIGLFRSEFLFLESADYPTEETQYQAYKAVLETLQGRQVILRTMDIGADKQASYFKLPAEKNPALGLRAIRLCLARPDVFKTQLRAIYRASAHGNAAIMLPMVVCLQEVRQAKALMAQARQELEAEGIPFSAQVPVGVMIETPAAALISDLLAKEVDFFSIGTNDLTQYTLAIDRMNPSVSGCYDKHHEALMRLIALVAHNAKSNGIWAGICGELGADKALSGQFIEMGIEELSVAPNAILSLRKHISKL